MNRLAASAVATALLALPAPAMAQSNDPFGPLGPSAPPQEPEPEPQPVAEEDDAFLGTTEALGFAAITLLIIAGVFFAIGREGRRMERRAKRAHRQRRSKRSARPADLHRSGTATATARRAGGEGGAGAKRPPPPPRKRRAKAKRR